MRQQWNERGSTLLYVLFAIAVLVALSPLIINMVSARSASDVTYKNLAIANQMTLSAMETVVSQINTAMDPPNNKTLAEALNQYPGWSNANYSTVNLPDGNKVTHSQWLCHDPECTSFVTFPVTMVTEETIYYIRIRTIAGDHNGNHLPDEPQARKKEIVKYVKLKPDGSGGPEYGVIDLDDPNNEPVCLLPGNGSLIYGNSAQPEGIFHERELIREAIADHIEYSSAKITTIVNEHLQKAETCHCTVTALKARLNSMDKTKPRYIKWKKIREYWDPINDGLTSTEQSPVILIVETETEIDSPFFDHLRLYGDVVIVGNGTNDVMNMTSGTFRLTTYQGKNEDGVNDFGNLYIMGNIYSSTGFEVTARQGHWYVAGNATVTSNPTIDVRRMTITGKLQISNTHMRVTAHGGNITLGSLELTSGSGFLNGSTRGDLLIRDDLTVNNNANSIPIQIPGVIAVGRDVKLPPPGHHHQIIAGGGETSIYLPGYSDACPAP